MYRNYFGCTTGLTISMSLLQTIIGQLFVVKAGEFRFIDPYK